MNERGWCRDRVLIGLVPALIAQLSGCGGGPSEPPPPPTVAQVVVTPGVDTLASLGATRQFSAVARDEAGDPISDVSFAWSTSNPTVATVGAGSGLATAAGEGTASITAAVGSVSGSAALVVIQEVASVEVTPASATLMTVGATQQFAAMARDAGGSAVAAVRLLWISSDPAVATVDTLGLATARAAGEVTITAAARGVPGHAALAVTPQAFATVDAGENHTCAVTTAGAAYCWGRNSGRLGDGTMTNRSTPVPVAGGLVFAAVSAGGSHTCGVTPAGAAHCWGFNTNGQLGDGTMTDRAAPVAVSGAPNLPGGVSTGGFHTCGVAPDETVFCWGHNGFGQLGDGATTDRTTPVDIGGPFAGVSAGAGHTCGVLAGGGGALGGAAGDGYCWGFNLEGELGDGSTTNRSDPVPVFGGISFADVSAGGSHTCGRDASGTVYCWGRNISGQLGDGTTTDRSVPGSVLGGLRFATISAGAGHGCGVTTTGTAYCWGANSFGQLGDGSFTRRETPVAVAGGPAFTAVSAGGSHTCGLTTDSAAYCWGANDSGQLGSGSTGGSAIPVRVSF